MRKKRPACLAGGDAAGRKDQHKFTVRQRRLPHTDKGSYGLRSYLPASALFVAIGLSPDNQVFSDLVKLDDYGYVLAGEDCCTSAPGVFVAGDTRTKLLRQIVTAVADGAVAAMQAERFLR